MRTIDVGIGHDDNLIVAQLVDVGILRVFTVNAEAHTDTLDDVHHRLCLEHKVPLNLFHVQDLTTQGQDGLEVAVAALLGRTTSGVTLDEEDLTLLGILVGAVGQLTRQATTRHRVLTLYALTGLTGCNTGCGGQNHLLTDGVSLFRVFLQIVGHRLTNGLLYGTVHLAVAQLGLGLTLELGLGHLDGDDGRQAFAEVVLSHLDLGFLNLLAQLVVFIRIFLQRTSQGDTETSQVGTTLDGVDIVDVRVDVFRIVAVVEQGNLDGHTVLLRLQTDGLANDRGAVTVDVTHELLQTFLGVEHLGLTEITFLVRTKVGQRDGDACIQISQLTHTLGNDIVFVFCRGEDGAVGPELLAGTSLVGVAHNLHVVEGLTLLVFLLVDMAIAEYL